MFGYAKEVITFLLEQDQDKIFEVKVKNKGKTDQQNKYLWKLMTLCVEKQTGRKNKDDIEELYVRMLIYTGALVDYYSMVPEAFERFDKAIRKDRKSIRSVIINDEYKKNGKDFVSVRVVYGSSQFDTIKENLLISNVLDYANNLGIDTEPWREMFK